MARLPTRGARMVLESKLSRRAFIGLTSAFVLGASRMAWADDPQELQAIRIIELGTEGRTAEPPVLTGVSLSADGQTLATCGDDHLVRLWSVNEGRMLRELRGH